jgi:hypothetical protein
MRRGTFHRSAGYPLVAMWRVLAVVLAVLSIAARSVAAPAPAPGKGPAIASAKVVHALLAQGRLLDRAHHERGGPQAAGPLFLPPPPPPTVESSRGIVVRELDWSTYVAPHESNTASIAPVARGPPGTVR